MDIHHARFDALIDTVKEVSSFVLSHFLDPNFTKRVKVDGSIVTSIDCKAEEMAKEFILSRFPDDSILGEEYGTVDGSTAYQWVIDPIDGTASFARGVPLFGTQIGLQHSGEPIAGAIDLPATGDFISAIVGEGAFHNNKRCIMSERSQLKQLMVSTTSYEYYQQTQFNLEFQCGDTAIVSDSCFSAQAASTRSWNPYSIHGTLFLGFQSYARQAEIFHELPKAGLRQTKKCMVCFMMS